MWYENSNKGRAVYRPTDDNEAIAWMEMTLPAMLTQTTFVVKTFFDEVSRANPRIDANTANYVVRKSTLDDFTHKIGAIEDTLREQKAFRGGIFIPYEGAPNDGFRLEADPTPQDLNRDLVGDNAIFEQLLKTASSIISQVRPITGPAGENADYTIGRRYLSSLVDIYTCPAAETWIPPRGLRYREVRHALIEAREGQFSPNLDPHVVGTNAKIPEGRIMPLLKEITSLSEVAHVSQRVASAAHLASAQIGLDLETVSPAPERAAPAVAPERPAVKQPAAPKPSLSQSFMDF